MKIIPRRRALSTRYGTSMRFSPRKLGLLRPPPSLRTDTDTTTPTAALERSEQTLNLVAFDEEHKRWRQWMDQVLQSRDPQNKESYTVRDIWNDINSTISRVLVVSSEEKKTGSLNSIEISQIIGSLLTPTVSLQLIRCCHRQKDCELLLTIYEFVKYHGVTVHHEMVTTLFEALKGQKQFEQNVMDIFKDTVDGMRLQTNPMSKRERLKMKRRQKLNGNKS